MRGRPPVFHRDLSSNRWKMERFFAWLDNFRRLATRFERLYIMYLLVLFSWLAS
ncbi:transposase [Bilophila wadsworthia]|uniref:transposase n=1 Tax=Bilophila wadsworthia TaxID=35833 RepID=UPI003D6DBFB8